VKGCGQAREIRVSMTIWVGGRFAEGGGVAWKKMRRKSECCPEGPKKQRSRGGVSFHQFSELQKKGGDE